MSREAEWGVPLARAQDGMRALMVAPENQAKPSWMDESIDSLAHKLNDHVEYLNDACRDRRHSVARIEAANVANFAWMMAERAAKVG